MPFLEQEEEVVISDINPIIVHQPTQWISKLHLQCSATQISNLQLCEEMLKYQVEEFSCVEGRFPHNLNIDECPVNEFNSPYKVEQLGKNEYILYIGEDNDEIVLVFENPKQQKQYPMSAGYYIINLNETMIL